MFRLTLLIVIFYNSVSFGKDSEVVTKNQCVLDTVVKYGHQISPTYEKAVCTELVIGVIEKFYPLDNSDKSRIRIITNENVYDLLAKNSPVTKGVYYALIKRGIGIPVDSIQNVQPGDFVQFWNEGWGHCGIVKSVDVGAGTMELYSSFPSTEGYGIQNFEIPKYCYFVRLK
jgi:hypothetical protein